MSRLPVSDAIRVGWSIYRSLRRVRPPAPSGDGSHDHALLGDILARLQGQGADALPRMQPDLDRYVDSLSQVEPDRLTTPQSLVFWINLYNGLALSLAASAVSQGVGSVFRMPGGFSHPRVNIVGESLSLDAIEHAKIRRFHDPRIHAALVCGAVSCPTLRNEPFDDRVDFQLEDQMRRFLAEGALRPMPDEATVILSPIFWWFGRDFTHPWRMPTLRPTQSRAVLAALAPWIDEATSRWIDETNPRLNFGSYDWSVACRVG